MTDILAMNTSPTTTRRSPMKLLSRQSTDSKKKDGKGLGGGKYSWKPDTISLPVVVDTERLSDTDTEDFDGGIEQHHHPRSPRINFYNENTWWLVDLHQLEDLPPHQGASFLVARCMHKYKWSEKQARRVLKAYFQFLSLHKDADVAFPIWPCPQVLKMWKEHSLDAHNYPHDCELLIGREIPFVSDADVERKDSKDQTKKALGAEFGKDFDKALWGRR